ncbi:MAG: nucleoside monophosphate kinase, partial [Fimbriimonadales bacterium]|nr:nucleoside monophosphate kinase [Fimbriimonadales bacterium]
LLREAMANNTPLGEQARAYVQRGELVPDELVNQIVFERLQTLESFVLDGYPRNLSQAQALDAFLQQRQQPLHLVLAFELDDEQIVQRLSGRRICPQCGAIYHLVANPSRAGDHCERCGATLIIRDDDQPDTIRRRLAVYREQTEPLIAYYEQQSLLQRIDASGDPDAVYQRVLNALFRRQDTIPAKIQGQDAHATP